MIIRQECRKMLKLWLMIDILGAFVSFYDFTILHVRQNSDCMDDYNRARRHVLNEFTIKWENHHEYKEFSLKMKFIKWLFKNFL